MADGRGLQKRPQVAGLHGHLLRLAADQLHRRRPAQGVQPVLQPSDAGLHGVVRNDGAEGFIADGQLLRLDAGLLHGLGQQVPPGDLELLQGRIAGERDDLHPVQQGAGDGVGGVGGADEQHVGQVIGHIHVVVGEGGVLLRVQHLQQGARGVATVVPDQLIHLVQHHHRIGGTAAFDALHDAAGHGADVGTAVTADLRLVPDAAQAHPHILAAQCLGDALADAGLAGTRRAHKEKDGAGLLLVQGHDSDLLEDAALGLLQAEVVLVQHGFCCLQVDISGRLLLPDQAGDEVQIVVEHPVLVAFLAALLHAVEHLFRLSPGGVVHAGLPDFLLEFLNVGHILRMELVQLILEEIDLLADGLLPVELLVVLLLGTLGLAVDLEQL